MRGFLAVLLLLSSNAFAANFDHAHQALDKLLKQYVVVYDNGLKSAVNYTELAREPHQLTDYLATLSSVSLSSYQQWNANQQLAFLINAYNAFTLQLIIENNAAFTSGDATSIRDLGGFFSTPWQQTFFVLLEQERTLDWIEHEKIRIDFAEPRIHAALVCAAISCPKLRAEAFTAAKLDAQLEDQMVTFLSDTDKNGLDQQGLYLSKIFDWYRQDFGDLKRYMQSYSQAFENKAGNKQDLNAETPIRFTDYNWQLNSVENL